LNFQTGLLELSLRCIARHVVRAKHLANFGLAFPSGPMMLVKLHELHRALDGFFFRGQLEYCVAANDLLGFAERAVDDADLALGKLDARALRGSKPKCSADLTIIM
jgi:hypothetical protein